MLVARYGSWIGCLLLVCCAMTAAADETNDAQPNTDVLVVIGAGGNDEYQQQFMNWAENWRRACAAAEADFHLLGIEELPADAAADADRQALQQLLTQLVEQPSPHALWLVLIGHGTFDGQSAKFNLRRRDVSADDLAAWLTNAQRPIVILNCSSASGPFIPKLAGDNRIVVAATKSGFEVNFSRFGGYLSLALLDPTADLDKDQQVSLLEAFIAAAHDVGEFYSDEGRLASEHAILDDNGDGQGIAGDWFRGVRATRAARDDAPADGLRARQTVLIPSAEERQLSPEARAQRDQLEQQLEELRSRKSSMSEDEYYGQLETLLLEIVHLRRSATNER